MRQSPSRSTVIGAFAICAFIFMLYSVAFGHNFLFDEENIILRNPLIRNLADIPEFFKHGYFYFEGNRAGDWQQYYRPITLLTFSIDFQFWKLNPLGYNLTNTLLHSLVGVLFFLLLVKILENRPAAFLAAFLYSVHTVHTEAVTYIASRGDVLGTALLLAALLCYASGWVKRTLVLYGVSLFAKESSILLPAYLFIFDICFLKTGRKSLMKKLAPFVGVAFLFLVFRKFFSPVPLGPPSDNPHDALLRVLSMGEPFLSYLQAIVFPEVFKFCQEIRFAADFPNPQIFKTVFIFFLTGILYFLAFRRRGAAFFGMSLFLIGLLPYSQIVHFYPEWAEHYLYFPSLGLAVLLGCLIKEILNARNRPAGIIFLTVYTAFFIFLCHRTWQRNSFYNNTEKYYERLAESDSPFAFFGDINRARLAMERGAPDEAFIFLKKVEASQHRSHEFHNLFGLYYFEKGLLLKGIEQFRYAYKFSKTEHQYLINIGVGLTRLGKYKEAVKLLEGVQKKSPKYLSVYTNLIAAYELSGKPLEALGWAQKGLEMLEDRQRDHVVLRMAIVRLAYRQGWESEVKEQLKVILEKYPDAFWYGDMARLLAGKITAHEFLDKVQQSYPGFESNAKTVILIALVLHERRDLIPEFLAANEEVLEKQAKGHPLMRKELEKAREILLAKG